MINRFLCTKSVVDKTEDKKQINKVLQKEQTGYRLLSCRYSLPYNCNKTYKTPYLVNTESVVE